MTSSTDKELSMHLLVKGNEGFANQGAPSKQVPVARTFRVTNAEALKHGDFLTPDNLAGCFCPAGTIYNHEVGRQSAFLNTGNLGYILPYTEVGLHLATAVSYALYSMEMCDHMSEQGEPGKQPPPDDIPLTPATMFFAVSLLLWLFFNVFLRVYFFGFYMRTPHQIEAVPHYKPTLIAKIFFPLSTVYYHEHNILCGPHFFLAYLCKCWYVLPCYEPSHRVEDTL